MIGTLTTELGTATLNDDGEWESDEESWAESLNNLWSLAALRLEYSPCDGDPGIYALEKAAEACGGHIEVDPAYLAEIDAEPEDTIY